VDLRSLLTVHRLLGYWLLATSSHGKVLFCVKPMPARMSETFVLRTYPFRESDLIVSFFTRDLGKLRGVARRARRPKSPFGSGLERLSHVRMAYFQRENAELVNLSGCDLIQSQFAMQSEYARSVALDYFTEVAEQLLPPHEPNEKFFRLMMAVLADLRAGGNIWQATAYFTLWAVRLTGVLPELRVTNETAEIVAEMFAQPIANLCPREWTKSTAIDLRRGLIRTMEQHVERRFLTVPLLEAL
jgi:DNA repair protein RecO (recombination protein O)